MKKKTERTVAMPPSSLAVSIPQNESVTPTSNPECPCGVCDPVAELIEAILVRDAEIEDLQRRLAQIERWWRVLISDVDRYIEQRQSGKDE